MIGARMELKLYVARFPQGSYMRCWTLYDSMTMRHTSRSSSLTARLFSSSCTIEAKSGDSERGGGGDDGSGAGTAGVHQLPLYTLHRSLYINMYPTGF